MKLYLLLLSIILFWIFYPSTGFIVPVANGNSLHKAQESVKDLAFTVLKQKCNTCHATKKRTDIFTLENMDSLAVAIQIQVFIKKKMPKGRKVKLTRKELLSLEQWVTAVLDTKKNNE